PVWAHDHNVKAPSHEGFALPKVDARERLSTVDGKDIFIDAPEDRETALDKALQDFAASKKIEIKRINFSERLAMIRSMISERSLSDSVMAEILLQMNTMRGIAKRDSSLSDDAIIGKSIVEKIGKIMNLHEVYLEPIDVDDVVAESP
ncbi:MAG: hypothetical protein ABIR96_09075, partial [Bdellovibrionota bacterium]